MSDEIKKVYEQYKHLDRLLSNIDYMSSDNFSGKIMHDLWQAVKSAQQSMHPMRESLAQKVSSKSKRSAKPARG